LRFACAGSDQQIDEAEAKKLSEILGGLTFSLLGEMQSDDLRENESGFQPIVQDILLHEDVVARLLTVFDQQLDEADLGGDESCTTPLQAMLVDCLDFLARCTTGNLTMQSKVSWQLDLFYVCVCVNLTYWVVYLQMFNELPGLFKNPNLITSPCTLRALARLAEVVLREPTFRLKVTRQHVTLIVDLLCHFFKNQVWCFFI
jgi:hypothetical protein